MSHLSPAWVRTLLLAALWLLAGCTLTPARDALQAAQTYADAVSRVDADAMIEMWDPEVVSRGDPLQDKQMILSILDPSQMSTKEEIRGISPEFSDSVGMHFFVGNTRTTRRNDGTQIEMDNFYIVTSRDFGRTWKIVDLGCTDERWIRGVAPGWTGFPTPPAQDLRVTRTSVDVQILGSDDASPPAPRHQAFP